MRLFDIVAPVDSIITEEQVRSELVERWRQLCEEMRKAHNLAGSDGGFLLALFDEFGKRDFK